MDPITREEQFLAAAAGDSVDLPEPITNVEVYLKRIAENGGGTGNVTVDDDGNVYVGDQCIIAYLTQEEYEALDTPDELTQYNIIPSTEVGE